jgi:outer membrane lipoprotein-sorting protein
MALTLWAVPTFAQTADEIIEKHLAATGGREKLAKVTSRVSTGAISLTTPVGELKGTIELSQKRPNKTRTLIKIDASAIGGGQITSDQRFDGTSGYVIDSFNGNRDITGDQLEAMKAGSFPTPFLNYKETGMAAALGAQEKVDTRDAYVVQLKPKTGPGVKAYFDAENFMLVKTIITVNVPQLGGPIDQVVEFSDFRDVDGIKIPYLTKSSNPVQTVVATVTDVKQNIDIDDSSFAKPAQ